MPEYSELTLRAEGDEILVADVNQYYRLMKGLIQDEIVLSATSVPLSIIPTANPADGTTLFRVTRADGSTVMFSVTNDGQVTLGGQLSLKKGADIPSAATLALGEDGNFFHVTGTTTITAIESRPAGHSVVLVFDDAVPITHNATSLKLRDNGNVVTGVGDVFEFVSEGGGNWREIRRQSSTGGLIIDAFVASGTWTERAGVKGVLVRALGGGGGGAGGQGGNTGAARSGGGGGGGGAYMELFISPNTLGATETVTIGAAGSAGTGGTSGNGTGGGAGGNSSFGSHLTAFGGGGGAGGGTGTPSAGGGGAGQAGAGSAGSGATAGAGGDPRGGLTTTGDVVGGAGANGGGVTPVGKCGEWGSAGGGAGGASGTIGAGGSSLKGLPGGGGGGGVSSADAELAGAAGGARNRYTAGGGGAGGAVTGGNAPASGGSKGGGGGGGNNTGNGGNGAAGDLGCGGGGGGGGTVTGGNGGAGGAGYMEVWSFF